MDSNWLQTLRNTRAKKPLALFIPSKAFSSFFEDDSKRILIRAANRTGKSRHAAARLATLVLENRGFRARAIAVDYQQAIKVIGRYLADFIPKDALMNGCRYDEANGWTHNLIRLKTGSQIQIMTSDQKALSHAGDSLDLVWIDEVPKPEILDENIARVMDRNGVVWLTATMIGRPVDWLKDLVESDGTKWVQHVIKFSHDNCPWYSKSQAEEWIDEAKGAPWSFEQRINASWEGVSLDRIYTGFDTWCFTSSIPIGRFMIGVGIDHGERAGHQVAILVIWDRAKKIAFVLDEAVSKVSQGIKEDANDIREMLARNRLNPSEVDMWRGDTNSMGKGRIGLSVNQALGEELGIEIAPADKTAGSVEAGEWLVNQAFKAKKLSLLSDKCPNLEQALRYYNGSEKLKHCSDALRYILAPEFSTWNIVSGASRLKVR
jgi:hypothetical protein